MRELWKNILAFLAILFLLPFLLILFIQGKEELVFSGREDLEAYLPMILINETDRDMHMETMKAQAVLTRSNVTKALSEGSLSLSLIRETYEPLLKGRSQEFYQYYEELAAACEKTSGEVVTYEDSVCYCPFFSVGSGITRDALEVFQDDRYPYLISVPSHRDEESESYTTVVYYEKAELYKKLTELYPECGLDEANTMGGIAVTQTDQAGYVLWMKIGGKAEGGESFRSKMGLPSACFVMEEAEGKVRITCKGRGHGFGFSLHGADAMARDGKKYPELIGYYFYNVKIKRV